MIQWKFRFILLELTFFCIQTFSFCGKYTSNYYSDTDYLCNNKARSIFLNGKLISEYFKAFRQVMRVFSQFCFTGANVYLSISIILILALPVALCLF